jgi:hypothetical protein
MRIVFWYSSLLKRRAKVPPKEVFFRSDESSHFANIFLSASEGCGFLAGGIDPSKTTGKTFSHNFKFVGESQSLSFESRSKSPFLTSAS